MPHIRIGVSGWRYEPWRGVFYPEKLRQDDELTYISHQFSSIELNGSFYALQRPHNFQSWHDATTVNFTFSVKGPRYISHIRRLKDCEVPLANFFSSGLFNLREKLGPILWQFPANFKFSPETVESFFRLLPRDAASASALAAQYDKRFKDRVEVDANGIGRLRYVMEVRHASFGTGEFVELLKKYDIGLVLSDSDGRWPVFEDLTSDLMYIRLHGSEELYASGYDEAAIERWAKRIETWSSGLEPDDARRIAGPASPAPRDVFCYFDNDVKVMAPRDARRLMQRLGLPLTPLPSADSDLPDTPKRS
jgi:uncharacterized protein YecE (DUF72 family)